jgi:hypothetical protein
MLHLKLEWSDVAETLQMFYSFDAQFHPSSKAIGDYLVANMNRSQTIPKNTEN